MTRVQAGTTIKWTEVNPVAILLDDVFLAGPLDEVIAVIETYYLKQPELFQLPMKDLTDLIKTLDPADKREIRQAVLTATLEDTRWIGGCKYERS